MAGFSPHLFSHFHGSGEQLFASVRKKVAVCDPCVHYCPAVSVSPTVSSITFLVLPSGVLSIP